VAANSELRRQLKDRLPIDINYAPIALCTDNAAMIASLGYYKAKRAKSDDIFKLDINPSLTF
jgi:N6-L-threonylcarbamoyladenine synthase